MNPDPSRNRRPALGYLAAFTLGMICMAIVLIVTRENAQRQAQPGVSYSAEQANDQTRGNSPRRTFADRASLISTGSDTGRQRTLGSREYLPRTNAATRDNESPVISEASQPEILAEPQPVAVVQAAVLGGVAADGIAGRAFLKGRPPPEKVLPLDAPCQAMHANPPTTRFYVVGQNNGLADVLVHVTEGLPRQNWPLPARDHVLNLLGCVYDSYVSAAQAGQTIRVQNLDDIMHNAHFVPGNPINREASLALLPNAQPVLYSTTAPEFNLRIKCDVHPWEFTYISLFEHPFFAVSDQNGNFSLPSLPAGDYTIEAFHRKSGTIEQKMRIEANRPTEIHFSFTVPADLQAQR